MRWVPLYVLTALVTGLHNFYWLMNMVNGAPVNVLNCLSLLGSATLLGAAVLLPSRRSVAAKVGLAGSLLSWVFYGPLMVATLVAPFSTWLEIKTWVKFSEYIPLIGIFIGPVLLIACTINATLSFRHGEAPRIRPQAN